VVERGPTCHMDCGNLLSTRCILCQVPLSVVRCSGCGWAALYSWLQWIFSPLRGDNGFMSGFHTSLPAPLKPCICLPHIPVITGCHATSLTPVSSLVSLKAREEEQSISTRCGESCRRGRCPRVHGYHGNSHHSKADDGI